ncbi:MAG: hypothetical protein WD468_05875 [Pirellulales bacterium]
MRVSHRNSLRHRDRAPRQLVRALCVLVGVLLVGPLAAAQSNQPAQRPTFDVVANSLAEYFASLKDYKPGDLINQSRVTEALAHVTEATEWDVPNREAIVKRALAENSFLVTQLATPSGRPFMRNVAKYPGSYSRVDRLSTIAGGQQFIQDLIAKKGGSDMIEYLATTRGGRELGAMMAGVQQGVDLNKPTGRIYTADDLLVALRQAYGKSAK